MTSFVSLVSDRRPMRRSAGALGRPGRTGFAFFTRASALAQLGRVAPAPDDAENPQPL